MPPAKRSTSTRSRPSTRKSAASKYKAPAALANLNNSIAAAEKAITQLSKHGGRDVSKGSQDLYKNLKNFVTSARRDSSKFAKAMQKDFDAAQKTLTRSRAARNSASTRSASTRSRSTTTKTTTRKATTAAKRPAAAARRTTKRAG